jgi:hypothetical protein
MTFNRDSIKLSQEGFINTILERFQMNGSHAMLHPIDLDTTLMMEDSVLEAEDHHHY